MKVFYTESFKKGFQRLPKEIQYLAGQKLAFFVANPRHPSLGVKKMEGTKDIWEARITRNYRFTFNFEDGMAVLRCVGTHPILRKEKS